MTSVPKESDRQKTLEVNRIGSSQVSVVPKKSSKVNKERKKLLKRMYQEVIMADKNKDVGYLSGYALMLERLAPNYLLIKQGWVHKFRNSFPLVTFLEVDSLKLLINYQRLL